MFLFCYFLIPYVLTFLVLSRVGFDDAGTGWFGGVFEDSPDAQCVPGGDNNSEYQLHRR